MRSILTNLTPAIRDAQLPTAIISLSGAGGAMLIALRTHASAPLCGLAHCPACYVAAALAGIGLALTASWGLQRKGLR